MSSTFIHRRRVEFAETDMAGIMHFSEFFRYMESAEHAFLRSIGHSVHENSPDGIEGFVRVHAECDYRKPLFFEDEVDICVTVRELKEKAIVYDFSFRKVGALEESPVAVGSLIVVCARKSWHDRAVESREISQAMAEAIRPYVVES